MQLVQDRSLGLEEMTDGRFHGCPHLFAGGHDGGAGIVGKQILGFDNDLGIVADGGCEGFGKPLRRHHGSGDRDGVEVDEEFAHGAGALNRRRKRGSVEECQAQNREILCAHDRQRLAKRGHRVGGFAGNQQ